MVTNGLRSYILELIKPDDVILDIGCCKGEFKQMAPSNKVIGYDIQDLNPKVDEFYNYAVVGTNDTEVEIALYNNPLISHVGRDARVKCERIKAVQFSSLLQRHPDVTVLKIDVEGSEKHYNLQNLPPNIWCLIIEWHNYLEPPSINGFSRWMQSSFYGFNNFLNWDVIYVRNSPR